MWNEQVDSLVLVLLLVCTARLHLGETLAAAEDAPALPFVAIDPATVQMQFSINDGPYGGREA